MEHGAHQAVLTEHGAMVVIEQCLWSMVLTKQCLLSMVLWWSSSNAYGAWYLPSSAYRAWCYGSHRAKLTEYSAPSLWPIGPSGVLRARCQLAQCDRAREDARLVSISLRLYLTAAAASAEARPSAMAKPLGGKITSPQPPAAVLPL